MEELSRVRLVELEEYKLIAFKEQEECARRVKYIEEVNQTNKDLKYENVRINEIVMRLQPFEMQWLSLKEKCEMLSIENVRL